MEELEDNQSISNILHGINAESNRQSEEAKEEVPSLV
jgi:hypothetical protein